MKYWFLWFVLFILIASCTSFKREGFTDGFRGFVNPKYKYTKEKINDLFAYFGIY